MTSNKKAVREQESSQRNPSEKSKKSADRERMGDLPSLSPTGKKKAARVPKDDLPGRNAEATKQRILAAACAEFAQYGYSGGRIDSIARHAQSNVQMIYRYFGGKDELYLAALEDTYSRIRALERQLELETLGPIEGMRKLIEFTFDYLVENPDFVQFIRNENVVGGKFARRSTLVPRTTHPLLDAVTNLLHQGEASGVFRTKVDPTQLYITILALCITHLSNRHTLSVMFQRSLDDPRWLAQRRVHATDVVLTYLTNSSGGR